MNAASTEATLNELKTGEARPEIGFSGRIAHVHKKDAEGLLSIDAFTGWVLTGQHDRPEWADGLVTAQLAERHTFYINRLGPSYSEAMKDPEVYAFEDLCWLGLNVEDGTEFHSEADDEHRMDVLATALGIDRESGDITGALADAEIARDDYRSEAEMSALEESQLRTGTGGE